MPFSTSSRASSSLSSHSDDEFDEDVHAVSDIEARQPGRTMAAMPPAKRRRLAPQSEQSPFTHDSPTSITTGRAGLELANESSPIREGEDLSSDSSNEVPGSPWTQQLASLNDEDAVGSEQVHVCTWDTCTAGDLGNQDELVRHVHDEHVGQAKKAKYTCEWADCRAKGKTQLSAYALRAHMRSHTKEKPFYCELPECDKSFTRSDALVKHMRTVHENDAMRSEAKRNANGTGLKNTTPTSVFSPAPSQQPNATSNNANGSAVNNPKPAKSLKLVFNSNKRATPPNSNPSSKEKDESIDTQPPLSPSQRDAVLGALPEELHFSDSESALPRNELYQLLRRQIQWASEDSVTLMREVQAADSRRKNEWFSKELVLENLLEAEYAKAESRGLFIQEDLDGGNKDDMNNGQKIAGIDDEREILKKLELDSNLASRLPMKGHQGPWYRDTALRNEQSARAFLRTDAEKTLPQSTQEKDDAVMADGPLQQEEPMEVDGDDNLEDSDRE